MAAAYSPALLGLSLLSYLAASLAYHARLFGNPRFLGRLALATAVVTFLVHTALIGERCMRAGQGPLVNVQGSLLVLGWLVMLIYLVGRFFSQIEALGAFALPLGLLTVLVASLLPANYARMPEELRREWFLIHVLLTAVASAILAMGFCAALVYLAKEWSLKAKRTAAWTRRLPPLDRAESLAYQLVALGFVLWTLGIATGAIYTERVLASYWTWDPKQIWSLAAWVVYALALNLRVISHYRGRAAIAFLIVGFLLVAATYGSVHYYGPSAAPAAA